MALVRAKLVSKDGGGTINFMFNPSELSLERRINLNESLGAQDGDGQAQTSYANSDPRKMSLTDLVFDTYEEGGSASVMPYVQQFEKALHTTPSGNGKGKRPPTYTLVWGDYSYIHGFITSVHYKLTMFLPNGTPVRAKVSIDIQEISLTAVANDPSPASTNTSDRNNQPKLG
jgi:hypothetical protein